MDDDTTGLLEIGQSALETISSLSDISSEYPLPESREFVYALLVRATKQTVVARDLPSFFPGRTLNPVVTRRRWSQGKSKSITYSLMPGYIFIFSHERMEPSLLRGLDGILRILSYTDGSYALVGRDEEMARWFSRYDGVIGVSKAVRVGEKIKIVDGPLKDHLGIVRSVDKRKQRAKIELSFINSVFSCWLDFDWIEE